MESLSAALDELYGGSIEPVVRTRGETQCVGFLGSFLDDAYTLDGSAILEKAAGLLGELLLRPCTEQGVFRRDYTDSDRPYPGPGQRQAQLCPPATQAGDVRRGALRRGPFGRRIFCPGHHAREPLGALPGSAAYRSHGALLLRFGQAGACG